MGETHQPSSVPWAKPVSLLKGFNPGLAPLRGAYRARPERLSRVRAHVLHPQFKSAAESFAGVTYHVQGELVPVLITEVGGNPVYFEHHILLWKDPNLNIGLKPLKGAFKRMLSGMPIFMVETEGQGRVGFSRDGAGHVFGIHFQRGEALDVREHQWLAATATLDYSFTRVQGFANVMFSSTGLFIDTFSIPYDLYDPYGPFPVATLLTHS